MKRGKISKSVFQIIFLSFSLLILGKCQSAFAQAGGAAGGAKAVAGANTKYEFHMSAGFLGLSSSSTQYDLAPGFDYKPISSWNWLQLGAEITYQKIAFRGGSSSNFVLMLGPTANFGIGTGDSFFITLGFILKSGSTDAFDSTTTDPNGSGFCFLAGKRFPLSGSFSLRPSLGVLSAGTSGMVFRPFAMSFFF